MDYGQQPSSSASYYTKSQTNDEPYDLDALLGELEQVLNAPTLSSDSDDDDETSDECSDDEDDPKKLKSKLKHG